jgi:hypothetical protein
MGDIGEMEICQFGRKTFFDYAYQIHLGIWTKSMWDLIGGDIHFKMMAMANFLKIRKWITLTDFDHFLFVCLQNSSFFIGQFAL